ncbi:MAG: outer membrane lipoprotein-sorting protein [Mariprofundus sp.]|nr:outer membrane lipoprotein-sorting protein [Mariprofundus sp.]
MTADESMQLSDLTGTEIILESLRRHELYPYVYEEQTLILIDDKGHRDVRRIQRYSRLEHDGKLKAMMKFIYPQSIAGASLLFTRRFDGVSTSQLYFPALGLKAVEYKGGVAGSQLLGSEFSLQDLMPEDMQAFVYQRADNVLDGDVIYFVVQAVPRKTAAVQHTYAVRKLLIRQDNFFVTHIDYLGHQSQLIKRQTRHDIRQLSGDMWRADMIMVENYVNHHRSVLKIDRRVYSSDYVPASMFETAQFSTGFEKQLEPDSAVAIPEDIR